MNGIFEKLYDMTAFSNIVAEPQFLVMYVIAFVLLYLGIKKQYEPLLLVPISFTRLPNISIPIKGTALGTNRATTVVTKSGK